MKRLIALCLAAACLISLVGCAGVLAAVKFAHDILELGDPISQVNQTGGDNVCAGRPLSSRKFTMVLPVLSSISSPQM